MSHITITRNNKLWDEIKSAAKEVAEDLNSESYAKTRIDSVFSEKKKSVSLGDITGIFDRNGDGRVNLDELDDLQGTPNACAAYNWEESHKKITADGKVSYNWDNGERDDQVEYFCVHEPQKKFARLADLFHESGGEFLDYVSDVDSFRLHERKTNKTDVFSFPNNLPLLLQNYEPILQRLKK